MKDKSKKRRAHQRKQSRAQKRVPKPHRAGLTQEETMHLLLAAEEAARNVYPMPRCTVCGHDLCPHCGTWCDRLEHGGGESEFCPCDECTWEPMPPAWAALLYIGMVVEAVPPPPAVRLLDESEERFEVIENLTSPGKVMPPHLREALEKHDPEVKGKCRCGGGWEADGRTGTVLHTAPPCEEFVEADPVEFVRTMGDWNHEERLKAQDAFGEKLRRVARGVLSDD